MSVILDEAALDFVLESPDGPIGRDLERRSENIVREVRADARQIIHTGFDPTQIIGYEIVSGQDGLESRIGVSDGRIGEYLVEKDARELKPFTSGLERGFYS
jgi:hypothetical protein